MGPLGMELLQGSNINVSHKYHKNKTMETKHLTLKKPKNVLILATTLNMDIYGMI